MSIPQQKEALVEAIVRLTPLTPEEQVVVAGAYNVVQVAKKEMLLNAGELCDFEAFVVEGCLRMYFIDESGKQVTVSFAPEGWWVGDLASFTQRMPARFFIEAVEPSTLLRISFTEKEQLFAAVPKLERAFRLAVQRSLSALQDRFVQALAGSAEMCYTDFLQKYPGLSARIPQQLIASYVGITPEFLSKLRSRMSRR